MLPMSSRDFSTAPLDTGGKLNAHKTFRKHHGGFLNVLCAFNLRPLFKVFLLEGEERMEVKTPF